MALSVSFRFWGACRGHLIATQAPYDGKWLPGTIGLPGFVCAGKSWLCSPSHDIFCKAGPRRNAI